ncbi:L-glutamate gamma-semialdehyde dehydrogenase [Sporomusa sphaeroides]|uniref:L-glutamate gamma-semialdehyde dehydrogenase n=2 Tax=Sporomusa TaxID=2375 RepID=A0ABP2C5Y7_9FIRM|nr:L-glutamate gamma-semialdehyde dehydrogenase [Sporomusa sphaeroides]OLS56106.1 1-pyrroline-5-carboxylate dehydrogenase 1 [Sporomusa sphaeroides DSM 2875]CVK19252.1 1-pyrroline-5-carboxylate dehydrogenase 1 [Sporomusa sphaeroides DSM 2875]SCM82647.1 Delta-1-pyrroline-5-carboxylate dehydrogenase [uncultured Sporomusa sp.]
MNNAYFQVKAPVNEPVKSYLPDSPEKAALKAELARQLANPVEIPLIIGGKEVRTEHKANIICPHNHNQVLGQYYIAGEKELLMAIEAAEAARAEWENMPWEHRATIFLKAADLLTGKYRAKLSASCMLGQSKNTFQSEIDVICELADFLRFNIYFTQEIYKQQPNNSDGVWNRVEYRALDGFVAAITPFNFAAIGGNLCTAPAMCGNTVLWKPSSTAVLANYYFMQILLEAGLPAGVINFVPCRGVDFGKVVVPHPKMAGFHFTGSTGVFNDIWKQVSQNIDNYVTYPRLVGETGGKDFIFAHESADVEALTCNIVLGAFEYQGQKCSAASRAYIPESLWPEVKTRLETEISKLKMGDVCDFTNLVNAVIDKKSFQNIKNYIDYVKESPDAEIIMGGDCDDSVGYFVEPTVIVAKTPTFKTMVEEIFGPVMTIYVYPNDKLDETLTACDTATSYALTGAVFAQDRAAIIKIAKALDHAAGNFYINDKPTGAVVGQQPFGGSRSSGTNDKAGSAINLYRWMNQRSIKETLVPRTVVNYPYMIEK